MELWLNDQLVGRLRLLANGMPYRWEAKKTEIVAWLIRYNPTAVEAAMKEDTHD